MLSKFNQQQKILLSIAAMFVLVVIGDYAYQYFYWRHSVHSTHQNCNFEKGICTTSITNGRSVAFNITPNDVPIDKPLNLAISLHNFKSENVKLRISNIHIPNCRVDVQLNTQDEINFHGKAQLPSCPNPVQNWLAMVSINTGAKNIIIPFRFSAKSSK